MTRYSATSISSLRVNSYHFAALTFIAMLFGCLLLPNPAAGDSTEVGATESQVGLSEPMDEPPPYAPWVHLAELSESQGQGDGFGDILAISQDGNTIVAGVPERDIYHDDVGLVRVFTKPEDGEWEDAHETATLTSSTGYAIDEFGLSVAISDDLIVVGEFYSPVYVFIKPPGGWQDMTETARLRFVSGGYEAGPGGSVAIMGDSILAGDSYYHDDSFPDGNSGAVFVWNKPANGWADTDAIDAMLTLSGEDTPGSFGEAMAASGNTL
ncbi:MAG: FG-GAP repeat protein, partial [Chloroflexota bacterium]|nr:FG-GAP repeat protein [Chloroflexota bacterium]